MSKKRITEKDVYNRHSSLNVEWNTYKKVLDTFHEMMSSHVIKTGDVMILPKRLGTLRVKKRKTGNKRSIDFHLTKKYGETIYHMNKHSEGYYGTFVWDKSRPQACFANKQLYELDMTRTNKRNLSRSIKEDNTINNYIEY